MFKSLPRTLLHAHIAFFASTMIWALAGPVIKITVQELPPFTFLFLRFLLVCVLLLPYVFYELKRTPVPTKDWFNFLLLGLFSQSAIIFVFIALKYTSVMDYTIISVISLIMSVYAGHYFYKEKVSKGLTLGLLVASAGTLIVVLEPVLAGNPGNIATESLSGRLLGNIAAMLYNFTWVAYIVWSKMSMGGRSTLLKKTLSFVHLRPMSTKYSPSLIVSICFYVGLLSMIPFALLEKAGHLASEPFSLFTLNPTAILGLLYMVVFSSIVAYMLNQWALEHAKVTDSALYGYLGIISTLPFAYLLLGELPNVYMLVGAVLITAGVIIAEANNN